MMFSKLSTLFLFSLAGMLASAQTNQSAPFTLTLHSANKTLDGVMLSACHTGAIIESLCVLDGIDLPFQTYFLNFSSNSSSGTLTWNVPLGGIPGPTLSEAMTFNQNPSSNVALPLFWPDPSVAQQIVFDKNNFMAVQSYVDDTVFPPVIDPSMTFYRWYSCRSYFLSYTYQTLNWVMGDRSPENPTCVKVQVQRNFL